MIHISIFWFIVVIIASAIFGMIVLGCVAGKSYEDGILGKREGDDICETKTNRDTGTERADSQ